MESSLEFWVTFWSGWILGRFLGRLDFRSRFRSKYRSEPNFRQPPPPGVQKNPRYRPPLMKYDK